MSQVKPQQPDALHEQTLESGVVYRGGFLEVWRDRVRLPDGSESFREYIRHPGAVVIVPLLTSGDLLFERQFRYPLGRSFWELPAGKIDAGEDIHATAVRELREETGHEAGSWQHLGTMHPCIGYSDERIEVFLARELEEVSRPMLDDGEFLEIHALAPARIRDMILQGVITDAKTITALHLAQLHLGPF